MSVVTAPTTPEQIIQVNATGLTPVVFIHGLWLLPSSWDRWATGFGEAGFAPLTPGWPAAPETGAGANTNPDRVPGQGGRAGRPPLRGHHRQAGSQAGRDRPLVRRAPDPDDRRARAGRGGGRDRPGAVSRRGAAS